MIKKSKKVSPPNHFDFFFNAVEEKRDFDAHPINGKTEDTNLSDN